MTTGSPPGEVSWIAQACVAASAETAAQIAARHAKMAKANLMPRLDGVLAGNLKVITCSRADKRIGTLHEKGERSPSSM